MKLNLAILPQLMKVSFELFMVGSQPSNNIHRVAPIDWHRVSVPKQSIGDSTWNDHLSLSNLMVLLDGE